MAYSRFLARRLTAEQMLDSISQATDVPEIYRSLYPGTRASQLPEPEIESYFLEVFDRPSRQVVCERKQPPTLNQALHLISGDTIQKKITDPQGLLANCICEPFPATLMPRSEPSPWDKWRKPRTRSRAWKTFSGRCSIPKSSCTITDRFGIKSHGSIRTSRYSPHRLAGSPRHHLGQGVARQWPQGCFLYSRVAAWRLRAQ